MKKFFGVSDTLKKYISPIASLSSNEYCPCDPLDHNLCSIRGGRHYKILKLFPGPHSRVNVWKGRLNHATALNKLSLVHFHRKVTVIKGLYVLSCGCDITVAGGDS